jgi:hypothetical protein
MLLLPCEVARMTAGSTPIDSACLCQCLTMASVLSINVPFPTHQSSYYCDGLKYDSPSKSNNNPSAETTSGGAENEHSSTEPMLRIF